MSIGIGFAEMIVICVIALLVVGPERLPGLVRTVGRFVGRARRMAQSMQYELEREINLNEISGDSESSAMPADARTDDDAPADAETAAASKVTPHPKYGHLPERAQAAQDLPPEDPLDDDAPTQGHADDLPPSDIDDSDDIEPAPVADDDDGDKISPISAERRGG